MAVIPHGMKASRGNPVSYSASGAWSQVSCLLRDSRRGKGEAHGDAKSVHREDDQVIELGARLVAVILSVEVDRKRQKDETPDERHCEEIRSKPC